MNHTQSERRGFLQAAGAAFTTSIFTGKVRGANDKINAAFIGCGAMGRGNIKAAMQHENLVVSAVCDVYQPNLDSGVAASRYFQARAVKDFREILADKSIDVVCIATPDHWHAYMTVEACKAGKDVYVEKPACTFVEEGKKMIQAARKYNRVVQLGTMQRSGIHFQQATDIVRRGDLGKIAFCRTWNVGNSKPERFGNPPDSDPPANLDWDMWQGPAPAHKFNANRFGVNPKWFSTFRHFWDYAGGMMTDWGVHVLDIIQMGMGDKPPKSISALGGRYWITDNTESPDTLQVTYEYADGFLATYEYRESNAQPLFEQGYGSAFYGNKGTVYVNRSFYKVIPEKDSTLQPVTVDKSNNSNEAHWGNFLECVKTRKKPICDIEIGVRSSVMCLLANVSLRSGLKIDWDEKNWTTVQPEARKFLSRPYRAPWKLEV